MGYGYAKHNVKKCPGTIAKGGCAGKGRPAPGHIYCEKCMRANEAASKAKATDARRAAAHRALDRVLDAAALRAGQYVSSREWAKGAAGKVIDVNAAGAKIEVHEPWPGSITEYTWRTEFWPKADWGALSSSSTTTEKIDAEAVARRAAKNRTNDAKSTWAEEKLRRLRAQYNFEKKNWPGREPTVPEGTQLVNGVLRWIPGKEPKIHSVGYGLPPRAEDAAPFETRYKGFRLFYVTGSQHGPINVIDSDGKTVFKGKNLDAAKKWCDAHAY